MAEFTLNAEPVLGGYRYEHDGTVLEEVTGLAIVSIAAPLGGETALGEAMRAAYSADLPPPGGTTVSADGKTRFLDMGRDQLFALFDHAGADAAEVIAAALNQTGYVTLQSDNWVVLRLSGPLTLAALERLCPIDLRLSAFPLGAVARTVMEHMGAIILHEADDRFLLLSASSSALSFAHAVDTSIRNVA